MAENWKHLYEQMKKMVAMYQDEIVPGLRQQVEELEAKIATDNNVGSKWISVKDRLPEELPENQGKKVIQCLVSLKSTYPNGKPNTQKRQRQLQWYGAKGWKWEWSRIGACRVTHWMPLPEPPKEEAQQDCTYNRNGHCMAQKMMPECDPQSCDRGNHHEMP